MRLLAAGLVFVAVVLWPGRGQIDGGRAGLVAMGFRHHDAVGPGQPFRPWRRWLRRGRSEPTADVLHLLDAMAPALRSGLTPAAALRLIADIGVTDPVVLPLNSRDRRPQDLAKRLVAAGEAGLLLAPVWAAAASSATDSDPPGHRTGGGHGRLAPWRRTRGRARDGPAELALVASAWALGERLGAPVADAVALAADEVRESRLRRHRLTVALAGPRATISVLTLLPLCGPLLALVVGVAPAQLYASPATQASIAVGVLLMLAGRIWCARMVTAATRAVPLAGDGSGP